MTLRHFQIFITVCDTRNMTAAASLLYISQPAVSQAIKELESHYKVCLFERLSKKLYLTQAGEKLMGYARHIIRMNMDAESEMYNLNQYGTVRIGASVTIGACVLPKLAAFILREHPDISIEVTEDNTLQVEQLILQDKLDVGLVEGEVTETDILCHPFAQDNLVLICGKTHSFSSSLIVEPNALEKENFILREIGSGTRKTFEDVMKENNLRWKSSWTCTNADTIKAAVAEGIGVSVISERAVRDDVKAGILRQIQIKGLAFQRQFKLVYHKNKYLTKAMKRFIKLCFNQQGIR